MPNLCTVRKAEVDTFKVIHSPLSGIKNLLVCKFGLNLRLLFLFEKDTLLPVILLFPIKSQTRDIVLYFIKCSTLFYEAQRYYFIINYTKLFEKKIIAHQNNRHSTIFMVL